MFGEDVGSKETADKPMLSLKAAEQETASAVKLLEADRAMPGTLLDIRA